MVARKLSNKKKIPKTNVHTGHKVIGFSDSLSFRPLTYGLQLDSANHSFDVCITGIKDTAQKLLEGEIELGLISSIAYALKKESWQIVPALCLSSEAKVKNVQLF